MERKIVENLRSGKGVNEICELLKIGKKRLANIRKKAKEYGYLDKDKQLPAYPEALFPLSVDRRSQKTSEADLALIEHKEWILARLEADWQPVTVHEEMPVKVSKSSFYRFLHRHGIAPIVENPRKKVISEIVYSPGEALLVDWGKLRDVVCSETGTKKTLWVFVGVMGHSRYMAVRLVWANDVSTTLAVLEDILRELGGVPSRIISDNPKCFSLEASKYEPLLNPAYERFASHYGLQIECLPPATPELKGKVERMMSYVRRLYQAHKDYWKGIEESQSYLNQKVAIANERLHGTTGKKPIDLFLSEEIVALKLLPAVAYEVEQFHEGKVRQDGHVRFDNKYYSLEEKYIGEEVVVIASSKQVTIYHQGKLLEVHERLTDPRRSKSTKDAHKTPWERELEDESFYRKRAAKAGPYVEEMIINLLIQGNGFIDTRKIWGILSLDKKYTNEQINDACKKAIELDSYGYRAVVSMLETYHPKSSVSKEIPEKEIKHASSKFVRPICEYQELINFN